jgi:hypothetical protein
VEDLSGTKYGRWTVVRYDGSEKWECKCECGTVKTILRSSLIRGRSKSCGCYKSPNDAEYFERTKKRLLKKVKKTISGCWEWTGAKNHSGYGHTTFRKERCKRAHRVSYLIWVGEIPPNLYVCHRCDNPACINPNHLFLGSHEENMQDMKKKNRACKGEKSHLHAKNRKTT